MLPSCSAAASISRARLTVHWMLGVFTAPSPASPAQLRAQAAPSVAPDVLFPILVTPAVYQPRIRALGMSTPALSLRGWYFIEVTRYVRHTPDHPVRNRDPNILQKCEMIVI